MKAVLKSILVFNILFICTACPDKEPQPDTVLWLDNNSDGRIAVFLIDITDSYSDTLLINAPSTVAKEPQLDFIKKNNLIIPPHSSKIIDEFVAYAVKSNISKPGNGFVYFVASIDSLEKYSWDKIVRDHTGITTYFIEDYSDYEKVNFRLRYPKY